MIRQPEREARDVNDEFYISEKRRINMLNQEFFNDIELTEKENDVLVWLCGWDESIIYTLVSAFNKVII